MDFLISNGHLLFEWCVDGRESKTNIQRHVLKDVELWLNTC